MALIAFLECVVDIEINARLNKWNKHAKILKVLPGYKITMGFGLHVGWAIEGAIGSEFKIDASYIGSNITMTQKIEQMCKNISFRP